MKRDVAFRLAAHARWLAGDPTGVRLVEHGNALHGADLRRADLRRACLDGADLTGADLTGADLTGAKLDGAKGIAFCAMDEEAWAAIQQALRGQGGGAWASVYTCGP